MILTNTFASSKKVGYEKKCNSPDSRNARQLSTGLVHAFRSGYPIGHVLQQ